MSEIQRWGTLRGALIEQFTFNEIKNVAGAAGVPIHRLAHLRQSGSRPTSKGELVDAIIALVNEMPPAVQDQVTLAVDAETREAQAPREQRTIELVGSQNLEPVYGYEIAPESALEDQRGLYGAEEVSMNVFIVHGSDEATKHEVARLVERLGCKAIILAEETSRGKTLIDKFEDYANTAGFAIVLLTPDDIGGPKGTKSDDLSPRARQNVVFELGYFDAKLGRSNLCALYVKGVELPSDFQGVVYVEKDPAGAWKTALAKEIQLVWPAVDLNKI
jgi:predicted nucleotide-binding protein